MRVLLGLGDVQLSQVVGGEHLGQRLRHVLLVERRRGVEIGGVVRHRRHVVAAVEQQPRQLTAAVGSEVEEDRCVAVLESRCSRDDDRLDELVRHAGLVAGTHRRDRIVRLATHSCGDRVERTLRALPALVAVHRVVATDDRRDPVAGQLGKIVDGRGRRNVAAVRERVDPRSLRRDPQQRQEMVDVRVHAAVRDEAEQVDAPAAGERRLDRREPGQRAVLHRLVHPHEVLVEPPPRPDRQVPDLGVAHLPGRQPRRLAGGLEQRVRIRRPESVEHRRRCELDGVARPRLGAAEAVEHDERYEREAARQIASNDSSSSDAPPTSAPSTAGSASSSFALPGFTEPP